MKSEVNRPYNSYNLEAERAVLGSCIIDRNALTITADMLRPDDFYEARHRALFDAIRSMHTEDKPVDYITLVDELTARDQFERLGGYMFLNELVTNVATTANVEYHAKIVRDMSIRRKIISAGESIMQMAGDSNKDIPAVLDAADKLLFDASRNKIIGEFHRMRDMLSPVFVGIQDRMKATGSLRTGYDTGFADLDALTGGLKPGSLNIIAARPSMGKTALALNIAQFGEAADSEAPVLIFSLEMPRTQLVQRMISAESGINLSSLIQGTFDASLFHHVKDACDVLSEREIYINDSTSLSAMEFRASCRRFKMRHPSLALVVVDYLQLMSYEEKRSEGRQQEVSDISRMLKATARELNCPVVALSQLSRQAENRTDKRPQLSDLRDSGAIEQDADVVMMLYREDYYTEHENNALTNSKADLRVAKNRNGGTGVVSLTFKREITRFFNYGEE